MPDLRTHGRLKCCCIAYTLLSQLFELLALWLAVAERLRVEFWDFGSFLRDAWRMLGLWACVREMLVVREDDSL